MITGRQQSIEVEQQNNRPYYVVYTARGAVAQNSSCTRELIYHWSRNPIIDASSTELGHLRHSFLFHEPTESSETDNNNNCVYRSLLAGHAISEEVVHTMI